MNLSVFEMDLHICISLSYFIELWHYAVTAKDIPGMATEEGLDESEYGAAGCKVGNYLR